MGFNPTYGDLSVASMAATVEFVFESDGIERTKQLARVHAELAMEAVLTLDRSVYRDALINLAYKIVSRTK